jgi:hypothetical protein
LKLSSKVKPSGNLSQDIADFKAAIGDKLGDGETWEALGLAIDVLTHPEEKGNYRATSDGSAPRFGKKETLRKIKAELEKLKGMSGPEVEATRELLIAGKGIVHFKLKQARVEKAAKAVAKTVSLTTGVIAAVNSCGASLVPVAVKAVASSLDTAIGLGQMGVEEMGRTGVILPTGNEKFFKRVVDSSQVLREGYDVVVDILSHPKKNKGFGGKQVGKKEAKQMLKNTLNEIDELIRTETDPRVRTELMKLRQYFQKSHDVVSTKLNKARAKKCTKITGSLVATAAATAACVATFGAATPIAVSAAINTVMLCLGVTYRDAKLIYELAKH